MTDRVFKPGFRDRRFVEGRTPSSRIAWLETYIGRWGIIFHEGPPSEEEFKEVKVEPGPSVRLMFSRQGRRAQYFNFSGLTESELSALRELFNMLFDLAEPIVHARDKAAEDAYESGDDSYERVYRRVPLFTVRKRIEPEYMQGLLERSFSDADLLQSGVDSQSRDGEDGVTVADIDSNDDVTNDNSSQAD